MEGPADSIYRMIKHLTWISARRREAEGEAERGCEDIPLSKLFFLLSSPLFLSRKPTGVPVQIAFRPAYLTAYPLARTYLIRINARAARKLASRPARTRHPRSTFAHGLLLCPFLVLTSLPEINLAVQGAKTRIACASQHERTREREREREGRNGSLKLGILIRPRDHASKHLFIVDLLLAFCLRAIHKLAKMSPGKKKSRSRRVVN